MKATLILRNPICNQTSNSIFLLTLVDLLRKPLNKSLHLPNLS